MESVLSVPLPGKSIPLSPAKRRLEAGSSFHTTGIPAAPTMKHVEPPRMRYYRENTISPESRSSYRDRDRFASLSGASSSNIWSSDVNECKQHPLEKWDRSRSLKEAYCKSKMYSSISNQQIFLGIPSPSSSCSSLSSSPSWRTPSHQSAKPGQYCSTPGQKPESPTTDSLTEFPFPFDRQLKQPQRYNSEACNSSVSYPDYLLCAPCTFYKPLPSTTMSYPLTPPY